MLFGRVYLCVAAKAVLVDVTKRTTHLAFDALHEPSLVECSAKVLGIEDE